MNDTTKKTNPRRYAEPFRMTGAEARSMRYHWEDAPHQPEALDALRDAGFDVPAIDARTKVIRTDAGDVIAFDGDEVIVWACRDSDQGDEGEVR